VLTRMFGRWGKGREKNVRFEVLTAVTVQILSSGR
jgi:hypothetical protein